jgi:hypothetical protein
VAQLTSIQGQFVLLTCHAPACGPAELKRLLARHLIIGNGPSLAAIEAAPLSLATSQGQYLPSGVMARWLRHP